MTTDWCTESRELLSELIFFVLIFVFVFDTYVSEAAPFLLLRWNYFKLICSNFRSSVFTPSISWLRYVVFVTFILFHFLSCFLSTEHSSLNFRAALHSQTSHIWRHALFFTLLHICRTFPDIEFQKESRWKSWTKMRRKMLPNNKKIEKATFDCHQMTLTTFKQQILVHKKRKRIFKFIQIPGRKIKYILCSSSFPFFFNFFFCISFDQRLSGDTLVRTGYYYRINMQ